MSKIIGVIGAGVMGKGVAQRFAQNGYRVVLFDNNEEVLNSASQEISRNLKLMNMFNKNFDLDEVMRKITLTLSYEDLSEVDYVVENVPEVQNIKEDVYTELDKVCKSECIYMANTSCIPITLLASFTQRPSRVIGVHFMNPVPMKNFSEVIKGRDTSDETINDTSKLLESIGISIEIINDSAGFVSNRLSHLFMNEAASLVYEGVATAEQIDNIFKKGFGHKMGPLETADLIGIDTVLDSLNVLYDHYEDNKYHVSPLIKQMVHDKNFGRKSGKGFYIY